MAGSLAGGGDKEEQLQDFSILELLRANIRRTIQESAVRKGSSDFVPRPHSEALRTMKLWHIQEQRQDKQKWECEKFREDSAMKENCKECYFNFRNCFLCKHTIHKQL